MTEFATIVGLLEIEHHEHGDTAEDARPETVLKNNLRRRYLLVVGCALAPNRLDGVP